MFDMKNVKKVVAAMLVFSFIVSVFGLNIYAQIKPTASAPPLTELRVIYVESVEAEESIQSGQFSTEQNHNTNIRVYVFERGYSNLRFAKMNSIPVNEIESYGLTNPGSTQVYGWIRVYDTVGFDTGTFTMEARSANAPWNTMSTSIRIR